MALTWNDLKDGSISLNFAVFILIYLKALKLVVYKKAALKGCCFVYEIPKIKAFLESIKEKDQTVLNTLEKIEKIEALNHHVTIAKDQREASNKMKNNRQKDELLIEIDFKQKIKIGKLLFNLRQ